jgi:lipopolysaccharide transport system permease protein
MAEEEEKWDLVIKPKVGWFEFNLSEIWRYRDLVVLFIRRDFAAHYAQTVLGPLWHFIQPILTTLMFLLVFSRIANIPTDGIHPILFYMAGITIWNYFSICLTTISNTFIINANIFGKVYFPRIILPMSVVGSNIIRFGIHFLLLLVTMVILYLSGVDVHITLGNWIYIPFLIATMASISLGLGIIIASITAKYRDFSVLLTFAVQLGMYATPIGYPMSHLSQSKVAWLIQLNPLSPLVECFRYCLFGKGTFTQGDLIYSFSCAAGMLIFGFLLFNRVEKKFMDTV